MAEASLKVSYLANLVCNDVNLDNLLQAQGPNQAQVLERLEKNKKYARTQGTVVKVVFSIMFAILPVMPLLTYFQVIFFSQAGIIAPVMILLAGGLLVGFYFMLALVYLLVLGIINTSTLLAGDAFKWLETLPISRVTRQEVCFAACFKSFNAPLLSLVISMPLLMMIFTGNILLALGCTGISSLNMIFSFSILVIFGEKFSRFTRSNEKTSKKANIVRIFSMVSYAIASMGMGVIVNVAFQNIGKMFSFFASVGDAPGWAYLFSLFPYPFAPGFLISAISMNGTEIPATLWLSTICGAIVFAILTWIVFRRAVRVLRNVIIAIVPGASKSRKNRPLETVNRFEIVPRTSVQAFRHKDLTVAGRDIQALMYLIIPLMMPLISIVPMLIIQGGDEVDTGSVLFIAWNMLVLIMIFSSAGMLVGYLNLEKGGSTLLATLPVSTRDQALAKLSVMIPVQLAGILCPALLFLGNPLYMGLFFVMLAFIPVGTTCLLAALLLKVRLFGKLKYKYVLEEVQMNHKPLKWFLVICMMGGIWVAISFPAPFYFLTMNIVPFMMFLLIAGGIGVTTSLFVFNRIFPRQNKGNFTNKSKIAEVDMRQMR